MLPATTLRRAAGHGDRHLHAGAPRQQHDDLIVQYEVEGLEVQGKDGSWIAVPLDADTVTVTFVSGWMSMVLHTRPIGTLLDLVPHR